MDAYCASCPWYVPANDDSYWGQCRRYPVEVVKESDDWCGEHPELVGLRKTARVRLAPPE